jgi:hypothetical protein
MPSRVLAIALVLVFAGCVAARPLPQDWDSGQHLTVGSSGSKANGAGFTTFLSNGEGTVPDFCVAYRDQGAIAKDWCSVAGGREITHTSVDGTRKETSTWRTNQTPDWVALAGWDTQHDTVDFVPRVVAFDAQGQAVAWWEGKRVECEDGCTRT